jgi:hypothetical protein
MYTIPCGENFGGFFAAGATAAAVAARTTGAGADTGAIEIKDGAAA